MTQREKIGEEKTGGEKTGHNKNNWLSMSTTYRVVVKFEATEVTAAH